MRPCRHSVSTFRYSQSVPSMLWVLAGLWCLLASSFSLLETIQWVVKFVAVWTFLPHYWLNVETDYTLATQHHLPHSVVPISCQTCSINLLQSSIINTRNSLISRSFLSISFHLQVNFAILAIKRFNKTRRWNSRQFLPLVLRQVEAASFRQESLADRQADGRVCLWASEMVYSQWRRMWGVDSAISDKCIEATHDEVWELDIVDVILDTGFRTLNPEPWCWSLNPGFKL